MLIGKIHNAVCNLKLLENLPAIVIYSKLYQERMKGKMPLLAEMYEKSEEEIYTILLRAIPKSMDVQGLGEGKQLYERYEEECLDRLLRREKALEGTEEGERLKMWIDMIYVPATMAIKCRINDYISKENYKKSIHDLYRKAKEGDEKSLLKIIKIDKTVILTDWAKELIKEKQHNADWVFFKRLGKKIAEEPFKGKDTMATAGIIAKEFWGELKDMTYSEMWELFREQELIVKEMDITAFKMSLNRAGLKKYSKKHNKK